MIKRELIQGVPCKHEQNDGDSMLWAGLLYAATGAPHISQGITRSQSPGEWKRDAFGSLYFKQHGRLWRSPARVNNDTENSFSRDMTLGFLTACAYDAKNRKDGYGLHLDPLFAFVEYINQIGKLCPDATDKRSTVTPAIWWQIHSVRLGLVRPLFAKTAWLLRPYLLISALTSPSGYQRHLVVVHLYIQTILHGRAKRGTLLWTAKMLARKEPKNPFFLWLAGRDIEAKTIALELEAKAITANGDGSQWFLERTDSENAWKDSCGHDFDFLRNLI